MLEKLRSGHAIQMTANLLLVVELSVVPTLVPHTIPDQPSLSHTRQEVWIPKNPEVLLVDASTSKRIYVAPEVLTSAVTVTPPRFLVQKKETSIAVAKKTPSSQNKSKVRYVTVTAYTSAVEQTDSTPCITANGFNVCKHGVENVIAANFLPFGARVRFPDMYGERIFTVQDRMNPRHYNRMDIWMKSKSSARQFGVRKLKVEIL